MLSVFHDLRLLIVFFVSLHVYFRLSQPVCIYLCFFLCISICLIQTLNFLSSWFPYCHLFSLFSHLFYSFNHQLIHLRVLFFSIYPICGGVDFFLRNDTLMFRFRRVSVEGFLNIIKFSIILFIGIYETIVPLHI